MRRKLPINKIVLATGSFKRQRNIHVFLTKKMLVTCILKYQPEQHRMLFNKSIYCQIEQNSFVSYVYFFYTVTIIDGDS
jgi:hypothetical protein